MFTKMTFDLVFLNYATFGLILQHHLFHTNKTIYLPNLQNEYSYFLTKIKVSTQLNLLQKLYQPLTFTHQKLKCISVNLITNITSLSLGFSSRPAHVGFVVYKVPLGQAFIYIYIYIYIYTHTTYIYIHIYTKLHWDRLIYEYFHLSLSVSSRHCSTVIFVCH